jgi:excinuclease ABC subunit C
LEGKRTELLKLLSEKMAKASSREDFEEAASLRDRFGALSAVREKAVYYSPAHEVEELKGMLGLEVRPDAIEAFDVSNIMGKEAVGSMIYFYKGRPKKTEYRRFKIKTVSRIDDYGMMRELINRRYGRLLKEGKGLPDLILIDGGKGHLSVALGELKKLGISKIPAIAIAKEFEHIYLKDREEPLVLPNGSKALHLLERIRDEAHRFAISYHRKLLSKKVKFSELDNIQGIGEKRKKALLGQFGSLERIRSSKLEDLLKVGGMSEKSAKNIIEYFKG